ncbi:hypothetical protein C8046_16970 [Serinibacter arcticus]|uniref:YoaR-like putative peptidoglycan binding domain-containing protein n=1 Tax=Serinibacter arcticus TaxID=1655435 RepID=A0A2U1ZYM3_9MICO|nr:hypothetical protein C8046_16970 [Serinibacter arcticus]
MGEVEASLDPATAGLTFDPEASVAAATGRTWSPGDLVTRFFGSLDVPAVTAVDSEALETSLAEAQSFVDVSPVDATIAFADGAAVVGDPVDGAALDVPAAVDVLTESWLSAQGPIELPVTVVTPTLDQAALDAAMTSIVDPLLSGPVTVTAGEQSAALEPATLTGMATVSGADGAFALQLDQDALAAAVTEALPEAGTAPVDASFTFVDGAPSIVPGENGTGIDPAQLLAVVTTAAQSPTERTAAVELVEAEPEFSTADAEALGIVEVISTFSTPMPNDPPRTENLRIAAAKVTGTLVKPGETFSLLETIGPLSLANGYNLSHGVADGVVVDVAAGGVSQMSTTMFNAGFEAGMEDVVHRAHSRWFDRYPAGREATVDDPSLDMQWRNNTPYGVLAQSWVADGRTHVQLWGTKHWDVSIESGGKYGFTSSRTIYNTRASCQPESGGREGFSIDVTRTVSLDGARNDEFSNTYTTTYVAWPRVVCGPDPSTLPPPAPAPEEPAPPAEG